MEVNNLDRNSQEGFAHKAKRWALNAGRILVVGVLTLASKGDSLRRDISTVADVNLNRNPAVSQYRPYPEVDVIKAISPIMGNVAEREALEETLENIPAHGSSLAKAMGEDALIERIDELNNNMLAEDPTDTES